MTPPRSLCLALTSLIAFQAAADERLEQARALSERLIVVDTHIDVPYRLEESWEDVTRATSSGDFDWPRAVAGGLDVPFMSIYTPAEAEEDPAKSFQLANRLIDAMEALAGRAPGKFRIVASPGEARAAVAGGWIALALGMENGTPIAGDLANVRHFRERGISYITLAHSRANHLSDSSYDTERPNAGLSEFGREVVAEMNRLGLMVDVSHLSDEATRQVLEVSRVPVIASHSSARHFTPGWERNLSDELIGAIAARGGLVMINFGSSFLTAEARAWREAFGEVRDPWREETGHAADSPEDKAFQRRYREENPYPYATVADVVAHIDHVVGLVGVAHLGLGSDYDGVGDSLPEGLKDVSQYPRLVAALLEAGYSEDDIAAILGGNLMRVWQAVIDHAEAQAAPG